MAARQKWVVLRGSRKAAPAGTKPLSKKDEQAVMDVTLRLRPKTPAAALDRLARRLSSKPPRLRKYLTRAQLKSRYGLAQDDIDRVSRFAEDYDLAITETHDSSRIVKLKGTVDAMRRAFKVRFGKVVVERQTFRVRDGSISIPASLKRIVLGVHGLDDRPVARPHLRANARRGWKKNDGSFTIHQVAELYNFPPGLTGKSQCIAIIAFNNVNKANKPIDTGYRIAELKHFFKRSRVPLPDIVPVSVNHGKNLPHRRGDKSGDDEVALDIEVAGSVAPGAKLAIYFAPNTTRGFIDAVAQAVYDEDLKPSVVSISWGGTEDPGGLRSAQFMDSLNETIRDAAVLGVTVCVSSGDDGAPDMDAKHWDGAPHVDFPASSPFALACGGVSMLAANGKILREAVWNGGKDGGGGGGGVSAHFGLPRYQAKAKVPKAPSGRRGRGVPDVSGLADPETGHRIYFDRTYQVVGGTSAVAPLMAGLLARVNESLAKSGGKTAGFINPLLYRRKGRAAFREVTLGDNDIYNRLGGLYSAAPGWNAATGLGVVDGKKLLKLLTR